MEDLETSSGALTVDAIPRGSSWAYWDHGGDLGTSWRGSFADSGWARGAGPLGYGETYLRTTVGFGASASAKHITTYFRHTFTVDDPAAVTAIAGEVMYDDGFVIYINGTRIGREAMPSGTTTATTLATGHEAGNAYQSYDWTAQKSLLVTGTNVIAVEVHQQAASSSDLVFDLSLSLEAPDAPAPRGLGGVSRNSFWRFWDRGGDLGTAWRAGTYDNGLYDDSTWLYGPGSLGYGESYHSTTVSSGPNPSQRYMTTYFREEFVVDNPSAVTSMIGELMYDDGAVIYLNGTRIAAFSMPSGSITASTAAIAHEAGNAYVTLDWRAHRGLLVPGYNVLAAEVHQSSPSSSDLTFDLSLSLSGPQPPVPPSNGEDIAPRSVWAYWDRATSPSYGESWQEPYYDDTAWARGAGPFGYGESYLATTTSYGSDPARKPITTFFRRWFDVDAPSVDTTLLADVMYDDGLVVYLNGYEIERLGMPAGSIDNTTRAPGHETGNAYERHDWTAAARWLTPGANLLTVEVHQASPSSSDLTFDLALAVDTPAVCAIAGCGEAVPPPADAALQGVWIGPSAVWAVGEDGTIGRRSYGAGGEGPWCWCAPDRDITIGAVWGTDDDDVWFVGGQGRVMHFDGGQVSTVDVATTNALTAIWGSGPDDIFVAGAAGTVRHFDGQSWTAADLDPETTLLDVWGASPSDVWASGTVPAPYPGDPNYDGSSGVIYRWDAVSGSWTLEESQTMYYGAANFRGLHGRSADDVWAVGAYHPAGAAASYSQAMHYDGTDWTVADMSEQYYGDHSYQDVLVGSPAPSDVWIVGHGTIVHHDGATWSEGEERMNLAAIAGRGTAVWAVGWRNSIVSYDGTRWVRER